MVAYWGLVRRKKYVERQTGQILEVTGKSWTPLKKQTGKIGKIDGQIFCKLFCWILLGISKKFANDPNPE